MSFKGFFLGRRCCREPGRGRMERGMAKRFSVADVATYKPNTDVKDYKFHVAMDDAHIAAVPWPTR